MQRCDMRSLQAVSLAVVFWFSPLSALVGQDNPDQRVTKIEIRPAQIELAVGERATIEILALDADGQVVEDAFVQAWANGAEASFDLDSYTIQGVQPGRTTVMGRVRRPAPEGPGFENFYGLVTVTVLPLPVARVEITRSQASLYQGTRVRFAAMAFSTERPREDVPIDWTSSNSDVVEVSAGGLVYANGLGSATLTATGGGGGAAASVDVTVGDNPIRRVVLHSGRTSTRVGDVVRLRAHPADASGAPVPGAEIHWTWSAIQGQGSVAAWLEADDDSTGSFVAHEPGRFLVSATVGSVWADVEIEVAPRPPRRRVSLVAHGVVPSGQSTTDLWVFEGRDGRDYVYTGTYSGNLMYAWDVTDPGNPVITDSVSFDGRRVNDVKINADASLAVVTSENASNRRNGITILDVADPAHPRQISHFTEGLTGGIHNTWIDGSLVYAVNYGTRDIRIVDVSDPVNPRMVGHWGLESDDRFLHDITILDGLAYLSYWDDGVVILDVGNGIKGGTPTAPKKVSQFKYSYKLGPEAYGNTHHAVRYGDYVFLGDEIFGCAECINGPRGYVHVVDVSDLEHPKEVAYYRVPEAGVHNMWAEDDLLYIGYYQAGLRVVDISGELRGDLYRQGREVGWFMTEDPSGTTPNATNTWGAQPYKGLIYASDGNSGLWVVRLEPPTPEPIP